ncbi:MAG: hypothetical protein AABZ12_04400 [Planctomycetota bacterium]
MAPAHGRSHRKDQGKSPRRRRFQCDDQPGLDVSPTVFVTFWVLIALVALGVRVHFLLSHPMRYDESYNYLEIASKSPFHAATHYLPNNHILHTLFVWASAAVFGNSPASLRLPALLGGMLLLPAVAWLAWVVSGSRAAAALAAAAVAASSALIEYSANARGYSWLAVWATLAVALTVVLTRRPDARRLWLTWGVVGALGAYTVPVMAHAMAGLCAWFVWSAFRSGVSGVRGRSLVAGLGLGFAVFAGGTLLLYAPVLLWEGLSGFRRGAHMAYQILGAQVGSPASMLMGAWSLWTRHTSWVVVAALVLGIVCYARSAIEDRAPERFAPLVMLLFAMLLAVAMRAPLPPRAWLFALPTVLGCASAGLWAAWPGDAGPFVYRSTRLVAAVLLLCLLLSPLITVCPQPLLYSETGGIVEVEEVLDDCVRVGPRRCAVVSPYTPALRYYVGQKGMTTPSLPSDRAVERVYIVARDAAGLRQVWNDAVVGYASFGPPKLWRRLRESSVYLANRLTSTAQNALDHPSDFR